MGNISSGNNAKLVGGNIFAGEQVIVDSLYLHSETSEPRDFDIANDDTTKYYSLYYRNSPNLWHFDTHVSVVFSQAILVPSDPYGPSWEGSDEAPTKGDLYDIIQTLLP